MNNLRFFACLVFAAGVSPGMVSASAATPGGAAHPDWPCEQILVPEVSAAVVWAGPSIEGLQGAWQQVGPVNRLVQRITAPGYDQHAADQQIAQFASALESQEKQRMLTLLFAGVFEELNSERSRMLSGILRYSRGQAERADRLGKDMDAMASLEDASSADGVRLEAMRQQMTLRQRIFDEREEFIQHLCSRPVVVEQRLGFLARSIASHLD